MIENSMIVNDSMPEYTVERISDNLNRQKKSLNGARVLQLGVAYKNDIDDYRESPAIIVGELLRKEGCFVDYFDPWVSKYKHDGKSYESLNEINPEIIKQYDIVVVTTAHSNVDYEMVCLNAKSIFDCKNVTKNVKAREKLEVL